LKVIEMFAGIGGFRLGLEQSGHEVVYTNEWLEKPRNIYRKHWNEEVDSRDIRTIDPMELPEADLICGGFPCATFSIAGKRAGLSSEDARGTLFLELLRLAKGREVPYLFFENVKGLLNHDNGRTFGVILASMDEYGYDVQWELLNSKNFGVPQNRERVFIIGNLRGKPRPKVFPIGEAGEADDGQDEREQETRKGFFSNISPTLDAHYYKGGASRQYVVQQWRRGFFREFKGDGTPTLTANMGTGGHNVPFLDYKDKIRKLTPLECERLQGLPDNFTKYYEDGSLVSDAERYERCGRTVTIPVIKAMGERLHELP
jgi:DNA (cytosine-5)-methyltransferase 1